MHTLFHSSNCPSIHLSIHPSFIPFISKLNYIHLFTCILQRSTKITWAGESKSLQSFSVVHSFISQDLTRETELPRNDVLKDLLEGTPILGELTRKVQTSIWQAIQEGQVEIFRYWLKLLSMGRLISSSSGKPRLCSQALSTDWIRPTQMICNNLTHLKLTDYEI